MYEIQTWDGHLVAEAPTSESAQSARHLLTAEMHLPGNGQRALRIVEPDAAPIAHEATVDTDRSRTSRQYRPACSCGWKSSCTTTSKREAQGWADAHVRLTTEV